MIGDLFLCCFVLFQEKDEDKSSVAEDDGVFVQFFYSKKKKTFHIPVNWGLHESEVIVHAAVARLLPQPPLQVWDPICVKTLTFTEHR